MDKSRTGRGLSVPWRIGLVLLAAALLVARLLYDLAGAASGSLQPNLANDAITHGWPFLSYAKASIEAGTLPMWNPYTSLGSPLLAEIGLGLFFPLAWIILLTDVPSAMVLIQFATLAVGAAGMFFYTRWLALAPVARFLCIALYTYALFTESFYPTMGYSFCMLPWVLWLAHRWLARGDVRGTCLLAIAVALCFLGGFPNYFIYTVLVAGAYIGCLMLFAAPLLGVRGLTRRVVLAVLAALLMLGLAAVQLLPTLELSGLSGRSVGSDSAYDAGSIWEVFSIKLLLQNFLQAEHGYLFGNEHIRLDTGIFYLGGVLLLVPFAFAWPQRVGVAVATAVALLCLVLFVLSYQLPSLSLIQKLPFAEAIRANGRAAGYIQFLLIMLACIGLSNLLDQARGRLPRPRGAWQVGCALAVVLSACLLGYLAQAVNEGPAFLASILACLVMALALVLARPGVAWLPAVTWALAVLVVVDISGHREHRFLVPAFAPDDFPRVAQALEDTANDPGHYRIVFMENDLMESGWLANLGPKYQLPSIDAYMGLTSSRWENYVRTMLGPERFDGLVSQTPLQRFYGYFSRGILGAALQQPGMLEAASLRRVYAKNGTRELQGALPRAYTVTHYSVTGSEQESLAALQSAGLPLTDSVVLEDASPGIQPATAPAQAGDAVIDLYSANKVVVTVDDEAPSLLVLTDAYYPGWEATIGSTRAPIWRANSLFRAVEVPAGRHTVTFAYRPATLSRGLWTTLFSLVLAALLLTWRGGRAGA